MNLQSSAEDETDINFFFESVQLLRSSWSVLHERCRKLEASLHEARIEKEQLQAKLELSQNYARKVEKEKKDLAILLQEFQKELKINPLSKWIESIEEIISTLNVSRSNVANEIPRVINDITIDSDDENDSGFNSSANIRKTLGNSLEESSGTLSTPNSTTTYVTNHDYQFASSTPLVNKATTYEVSVLDSSVSIENPLRCNSNNAQVARDVKIDVDVPSSQHSPAIGPSIENNGLARDDGISNIGIPLPENLPSIAPSAENNGLATNEAIRDNEIANVDKFLSQKLPSVAPQVENNEPVTETEIRNDTISVDTVLESQDFTSVTPLAETIEPSAVIGALDDKISDSDILPSPDSEPSVVEARADKISDNLPSQDLTSAEKNEPITEIENSIIKAEPAPETNTPSQECALSVQFDNEAIIPSTEREQNIDADHNILVGAQTSSKSLVQLVSPTKDEISPENQILSRSNIKITTVPSPENLVGKSVSITNDNENSNHSQLSEITDHTDPPQLISIPDIEITVNDSRADESASSSVTSPPMLIEYPSPCTPIMKTGTSVDNDIEISNSNQLMAENSQAPVQSVQGTFINTCSEIARRDDISVGGMFPPCRRLIFTSESLLQQGVNHEEIHPAEEAPFTNVPDTESSEELEESGSVDITIDENESMDCDKLTNKGATPEELMSQIFGSPDRNSDVVYVPNPPKCTIDLNLSNDKFFSGIQKSAQPIAQPEITVNLPRIFAPGVEITEESSVISYLENETAENQKETPNAKRPYPSSSEFESNPKRSSPASAESSQEFKLNSDDKKLLKCLLCKNGEEFDSYVVLDTHIIANHPNPYPYYFRCNYGQGNCKRYFKTTKKVNDHVRRRHAGEDLSLPAEKLFPGQKPWRCSICNKIFAHSSHLIGHLRKSHNVTETENVKKYESKTHVEKNRRRKAVTKSQKNGYSVGKCVICLNEEGSSEKFRTYQNLDGHISEMHKNPYPFYLKCPFCLNGNARHFKGLSWLNNHVKNQHDSRLFKTTPLTE